MGKVMFFIFIFIWLRGTLPRLRYDQFMAFGWKVLIPVSVVWIVAVAAIRVVDLRGGFDRPVLIGLAVVLAVLARGVAVRPGARRRRRRAPSAEEFDAFAGGYPVPPMPARDRTRPRRRHRGGER